MKYILSISSAVAVYCFVSLLLMHASKKNFRVKRRIAFFAAKEGAAGDSSRKSIHRKINLRFLNIPQKIASGLASAGIPLTPDEFILLWACVSIVPPVIASFFLGLWVSLLLVVLGVAAPPLYVSRMQKRRLSLFNRQLEDALLVISNSLRAGFTFEQSLESVANDMPPPIGEEFLKAIREVRLGVPVDMALNSLAERMQSRDLRLMNSAVLIQRQVGGNLSEILSKISETIHDRIQIQKEIKALTAQGRMSGAIISILPVFLFLVMNIISPGYSAQLYQNPMGIMMLVVGVFMEIIGFLVIRKIVNIRF
ncbi:hypothetical protein FL966_11765 [Caproiciproducens galactitolivorans]|uniref:Bacterial type II secretion system protein F domain protein n=1 Tax=Caproiciproducens galactitolivorans TaxID=642589 RepID=A0A4Z0YDX6_9FIRM|nr:type II secretion system F family protein [Caproiciproducens galactitolivorans]QEY35680.1 hypothetical protein FL966_11765 [Caproiciproducens galactitolivorans]TGJ77411.1 bacterial type II secretion system protein F domain protein [Caproiciproducens galactitolivorans]